jgi:hypothetical protein
MPNSVFECILIPLDPVIPVISKHSGKAIRKRAELWHSTCSERLTQMIVSVISCHCSDKVPGFFVPMPHHSYTLGSLELMTKGGKNFSVQ